MGNRLYVGNLPYNIDENGIRAFFGDGQDGIKVTQVKIIHDRDTGKPRGFAFVELSSPDHAKAAISKLHGAELGGRTIVVNEAREPGGGGGGAPRGNARPSGRPSYGNERNGNVAAGGNRGGGGGRRRDDYDEEE